MKNEEEDKHCCLTPIHVINCSTDRGNKNIQEKLVE